ncbi:MAG: acetylxylan esterase [Verrucomicrobiales bacterium]|nr:acetylxylan esterase [Verrucomicrobiales bacterium]
MNSMLWLIAILFVSMNALIAQPKGYNYDEGKVPKYTLPDPLLMTDGDRVKTVKEWETQRRPEILELFKKEMYGRAPGKPANLKFSVFDEQQVLKGKAVRKQVEIQFAGKADGPRMTVLIYLPAKAKGPVPTFLTLNFRGNHTVTDDPNIRLPHSWVRGRTKGETVDNRATEKGRGVAKSRWGVMNILKRGYGLATIYYGDIDPDFDDGWKNGVHALYPKPKPDEWGSIATWAWGLSRALDYFETDKDIDHKRVAVMGHSRLGKTSLWAGAADQRFALVISNNSGCGGAALSRRAFGETVKRINTSFPHWFNDNFLKYNDNENACPVDQHMLVALAAPRPVYIASAVGDKWADPNGEFLSGIHANPVYQLYGLSGLPASKQPSVDSPVMGRIGYHVRSGKHDVTDFDWEQYFKFADKHLKRGKK